jgi:hypothetical protein
MGSPRVEELKIRDPFDALENAIRLFLLHWDKRRHRTTSAFLSERGRDVTDLSEAGCRDYGGHRAQQDDCHRGCSDGQGWRDYLIQWSRGPRADPRPGARADRYRSIVT